MSSQLPLLSAYTALLISSLLPIVAGAHASLKTSKATKALVRAQHRGTVKENALIEDQDDDDDEDEAMERLTVSFCVPGPHCVRTTSN